MQTPLSAWSRDESLETQRSIRQTFRTCIFQSPVGPLHLVASDTSLLTLVFESQWRQARERIAASQISLQNKKNSVLEHASIQLEEYFSGQRKIFSIPLFLSGTPFQRSAWETLLQIPYGSTWSYSQQASVMGHPKAVRAVGSANKMNPLCIVVPCHRVIGKSGKSPGYVGGQDIRAALLLHESTFANPGVRY